MITLREKIIIIIFLIIIILGSIKFYTYKNYMDKQYTESAKIATDNAAQLKIYKDENNKLHGMVDVIDRKALLLQHLKHL